MENSGLFQYFINKLLNKSKAEMRCVLFSKLYIMKNRIYKEGPNSINTSSARPSNKGLNAGKKPSRTTITTW
jgi:hypothetical protein